MKKSKEKTRLAAIVVLSLFVIVTGVLFSLNSFMGGEVVGGILGIIIATTIFVFAVFVFARGNADMRKGFPLRDERSRKVLEMASSKAFYATLYLLLGIGLLSDVIPFRDVSQATGAAVGFMAILFAVFWVYYNRKAL
jgi:uncharacterized membrane protein